MYDLHIHSIYSDGHLNPNEIIDKIKIQGLRGFSITDHDSIDAIKQTKLLANKYDLKFIPGIEFGTSYKNNEIHILGYFIDEDDHKLLSTIDSLKKSRILRTNKIINNLNQLGITIKYDDLNKYKGSNFTSRSHIAAYLKDNGYTNSIEESFQKYLGRNGLVYEEKNNISIKEIIKVIKNAKGVSVLAHPYNLSYKIIEELISLGIDGIEIINSKHNLNHILKLYSIAENFSMIPTSGSDCHGRIYDSQYLIGKFLCSDYSVNRLEYLHKLRKTGV